MRPMILAVPAFLALAANASAGLHGVANVMTTLDGNGDRSLDSTGFVGSPTVFTPANTIPFADGTLTSDGHSYGWNTQSPRNMSTSGNAYSGNPDRADHSSNYAGEANSTGTLAEIFGVNNLSHIIDGEDHNAWTMDLMFQQGKFIKDDGNASTVELAIFERGWNSKYGVQGIYEDGQGDGLHYTSPIVITPDNETYAGWNLNTLEIADEQKVAGVGISLDSFGNVNGKYVGFRIYAESGFNGPDIVGVRAGGTVPAPATGALLGLAALGLKRRRR